MEERLLWEPMCCYAACVKVISKETETGKRILISSEGVAISLTVEDFNALKEAIRKGEL